MAKKTVKTTQPAERPVFDYNQLVRRMTPRVMGFPLHLLEYCDPTCTNPLSECFVSECRTLLCWIARTTDLGTAADFFNDALGERICSADGETPAACRREAKRYLGALLSSLKRRPRTEKRDVQLAQVLATIRVRMLAEIKEAYNED